MTTSVRRINKLNIIIAIIFVVVFAVFANTAFAATETIQPEDSQYLELRAVSVDDVTGQNKQVIMELWSHDLDFKGFEVTFEYDKTKFNPSNISTNVITDDETEFFAFESEFNGKLDIFSAPDSRGNVLDLTVALNTPISAETTNIKSDGNGGYKVATKGKDILLGKLSLQMASNKEFSIDGFGLVTNSYTPQTGIKIDISLTQNYQKQSTFRFTDETASRNANLSNLIVSSGEVDELEPTNSTYKEYSLTPTFDKDEPDYTMTLEEYIDTLDIKAVLEDETATMKIKVPERDQDDKLVKVGDTIQYVESTLTNNTKIPVNINKLGEPDTVITIIVTAEDGTTTKEYSVTIHRPSGTIKGRIQLGSTLKDTMYNSNGIVMKHIADITLYNVGEFNWDGIISGASALDDLSSIEEQFRAQTDDDGYYEIHVIPGNYDLLIERLGFLADVTKSILIGEGDVIDLNPDKSDGVVIPTILYDGDSDRSGIIGLTDLVAVNNVMGSTDGDGVYEYRCDFGQKGYVALADLVSINNNIYMTLSVKSW